MGVEKDVAVDFNACRRGRDGLSDLRSRCTECLNQISAHVSLDQIILQLFKLLSPKY